MEKTYRDYLQLISGQFTRVAGYISDDDIDNLELAANEEIHSIRKIIEGNAEFILSDKIQQTVKLKLLALFNLSKEHLDRFMMESKKINDEWRINNKSEFIQLRMELIESDNSTSYFACISEVIQEILSLLIEYFPEVSLQKDNADLFKKYLPKKHPFRETLMKLKNDESILVADTKKINSIGESKKPKINMTSFSMAWEYMVKYASWENINFENWNTFEKVTEYYSSKHIVQEYITHHDKKAKDYRNAIKLLNYWSADKNVIKQVNKEYTEFLNLNKESKKTRKI